MKERRDMNDKEMDDFFRKKAAQPDIPYREEDWEKLKAKLEHPASSGGKNGSRRNNKGWLMGLLAFMILTGAFLGWNYLATGPENTGFEADSLNSKTGPEAKLRANPPDSSAENNSEAGAFGEQELAISRSDGTKVSIKPRAGKLANTTNWDKPKQGHAADRELEKFEATAIRPIASNDAPGSFSTTEMEIASKKGGAKASLQQEFHLEPLLTYNEEYLRDASEKNRKRRNKNIVEPKVDKTTPEGHRFSVALSFAPDVTALKIKDIAGLGNSVGFNLEYFILPNLSINAGAMYAFKAYQGGEGYYTGYVPAPSGIMGHCWVLDLPLNVRYYAVNQNLGRWYISGGLSSYLMLREKYNLEYKSYGGKSYDKQLEVRNNNRHYLDIVNLGFGYERVLSDRLSLQVEPYLKLPLKGIGEGSINLKSAGALVGLKWSW
jgi:hypothetical protein